MGHDLVHIEVEGGCVTKPTFRHTDKGTALCKFGLVANPIWTSEDGKEKRNMYFTVLIMGKTAETIYPMLRMGMPVRVEGDYKDGVYRHAITDEPNVGRVIFASRVKIFVFWKHRKVSDRAKEIENMTSPDLDDLPF